MLDATSDFTNTIRKLADIAVVWCVSDGALFR